VLFNCHVPGWERGATGKPGGKQRFDLRPPMISPAAIVFAPAPAEQGVKRRIALHNYFA
jgi:hypothetical protein